MNEILKKIYLRAVQILAIVDHGNSAEFAMFDDGKSFHLEVSSLIAIDKVEN
jgi:hypothetical protein